MKKMKKYIALVLSLLMVCSVSLEVFAQESETDSNNVFVYEGESAETKISDEKEETAKDSSSTNTADTVEIEENQLDQLECL